MDKLKHIYETVGLDRKPEKKENMVKCKPILYSTPMVQAIEADRKTKTRRICKHQHWSHSELVDFNINKIHSKVDRNVSSKYQIGDVLWIRETWKPKYFAGHVLDGYDYKADHVTWLQNNNQKFIKGSGCETGEIWKPSIFMPKAAARYFLKVTDVRVERLQDITMDDCYNEGIENIYDGKKIVPGFYRNYLTGFGTEYPHISFISLWESINGPRSWDRNPWVFVYTFERIGKPKNF